MEKGDNWYLSHRNPKYPTEGPFNIAQVMHLRRMSMPLLWPCSSSASFESMDCVREAGFRGPLERGGLPSPPKRRNSCLSANTSLSVHVNLDQLLTEVDADGVEFTREQAIDWV